MSDIAPTLIEFRHEDTKDLLWRSVEPCPTTGDTIYYGIGSGALTEYLVDSIECVYRKLVIEGPAPGGGEQEVLGSLSRPIPTVYVSVV